MVVYIIVPVNNKFLLALHLEVDIALGKFQNKGLEEIKNQIHEEWLQNLDLLNLNVKYLNCLCGLHHLQKMMGISSYLWRSKRKGQLKIGISWRWEQIYFGINIFGVSLWKSLNSYLSTGLEITVTRQAIDEVIR